MYKFFLYVLLFLSPFALFFFINLFISYKKYEENFKKKNRSFVSVSCSRSAFARLFIDFPRCLMRDLSIKDSSEFPYYGCMCIEGEQGCGKTITMCYLIRKYKNMFPRLKIRTNFECSLVPDRIHSFSDIDSKGNGIYGELDCISELQTWFDCLQSKNFPSSALATITQQRHVHRAILTDTQTFTRVSKQIREQTLLCFAPRTFFNCITFVHVYKPLLDDDAHVIKKQHVDFFFFVHDDELRGMYNSYSDVDYGQTILKSDSVI